MPQILPYPPKRIPFRTYLVFAGAVLTVLVIGAVL